MKTLRQKGRQWALGLVSMMLFLLLWEAAVRLLHVRPITLPPPSAVLLELAAEWRWYLDHAGYTLLTTLGGFALAVVVGVGLAMLLVGSRGFEHSIYPLIVGLNSVPKVAVAPLFVIWLGYGIWPNIIIGTTIAFFPMVVNTAVGLASAEPEMLDLVRSLNASRWQVYRKIRFPNAVPYIFTGLKLNATMSVTGAIVGEFVASERGLGSLIITGGVTMQTPSIFASLILISALGLVLYGAVVAVENIVAPWANREDAAK